MFVERKHMIEIFTDWTDGATTTIDGLRVILFIIVVGISIVAYLEFRVKSVKNKST